MGVSERATAARPERGREEAEHDEEANEREQQAPTVRFQHRVLIGLMKGFEHWQLKPAGWRFLDWAPAMACSQSVLENVRATSPTWTKARCVAFS